MMVITKWALGESLIRKYVIINIFGLRCRDAGQKMNHRWLFIKRWWVLVIIRIARNVQTLKWTKIVCLHLIYEDALLSAVGAKPCKMLAATSIKYSQKYGNSIFNKYLTLFRPAVMIIGNRWVKHWALTSNHQSGQPTWRHETSFKSRIICQSIFVSQTREDESDEHKWESDYYYWCFQWYRCRNRQSFDTVARQISHWCAPIRTIGITQAGVTKCNDCATTSRCDQLWGCPSVSSNCPRSLRAGRRIL